MFNFFLKKPLASALYLEQCFFHFDKISKHGFLRAAHRLVPRAFQ